MRHDNETNKLYLLYDLIAKIHHSQDIRIYLYHIPTVIPVYLQKEYLYKVHNSPYSYTNRTKGIFSRMQNPFVYCKMLEYFKNNLTFKKWYFGHYHENVLIQDKYQGLFDKIEEVNFS